MANRKKQRWVELLGEQVVRVSRSSGPERRRLWGHLSTGVGLLAVCALFCGWIHVQSITVRYQVSQMLRTGKDLVQRRDSMEVEKQMLCSPGRMTRLAEQEFDMRLPRGEERVVLK